MAWQPTHQHYKGGLYRVLGQAVHTETEERMTVYQTEDGRWWVRPAAMFEETSAASESMMDGTRKLTEVISAFVLKPSSQSIHSDDRTAA